MSTGVSDLIKLADFDFKTCEAIEAHFPDEFAVRTAAYHLQQAVEKILKAVILYNGENPAFTHDIGQLANHCSRLGVSLGDELENVADTLTLWESKSRYDPYITFTQKKYDMAKQVYVNISQGLKQEISQQPGSDLNIKM